MSEMGMYFMHYKERFMKNTKVLLAAVAVMSFSVAFAEKAVAQSAAEIDSITPYMLYDGDSGSIVITGQNLMNSDNSPASLDYWSDTCTDAENCWAHGYMGGVSDLITFTITYYSQTEIDIDYTVNASPGSGVQDLGTFIVINDGGWGWGPDVSTYDPEE